MTLVSVADDTDKKLEEDAAEEGSGDQKNLRDELHLILLRESAKILVDLSHEPTGHKVSQQAIMTKTSQRL